MRAFKEVFFDCDGTLVDSEIIAMRVAGEVLAEGLAAQNSDYVLDVDGVVERFSGWHFDEMIRDIEQTYGLALDRDAVKAAKAVRTIEGLKNTQVIPGMHGALDALPALGLDYSLVTSSEFSRVNLCLEVTGLDVYFPEERKYSAHDTLPVPKHKPSPAIYLHALQERGRQADEVAAVEDSVSGVRAAVAANIFTIGFTGGSHIPAAGKDAKAAELIAEGAGIVISDMRDLPVVLEHINAPEQIARLIQGKVYFNQALPGRSAAAPHPQPGL